MSAEFAAAIAPELDRIRVAISRGAAGSMGPVAAEFGLSPATGSLLGMLRNLAPDRRTTRAAIEEVFIYQESPSAPLAELVTIGLVAVSGADVALTLRGVDAINRFGEAMGFIADAWAGADADFATMRAIATKAIDAACATGGLAFSVMAPPYRIPGASDAVLFAETLTPLRFHRFDAHIAAWREAGLTLAEAQALADGPAKDNIEADTNARAGAPYAALTDDERVGLLEGIRRLPTPTVVP